MRSKNFRHPESDHDEFEPGVRKTGTPAQKSYSPPPAGLPGGLGSERRELVIRLLPRQRGRTDRFWFFRSRQRQTASYSWLRLILCPARRIIPLVKLRFRFSISEALPGRCVRACRTATGTHIGT